MKVVELRLLERGVLVYENPQYSVVDLPDDACMKPFREERFMRTFLVVRSRVDDNELWLACKVAFENFAQAYVSELEKRRNVLKTLAEQADTVIGNLVKNGGKNGTDDEGQESGLGSARYRGRRGENGWGNPGRETVGRERNETRREGQHVHGKTVLYRPPHKAAKRGREETSEESLRDRSRRWKRRRLFG